MSWLGGGADAKVLGYVKAGYTGPHKGGREGRATLTALAVQGFFSFFDGCGGTRGMEGRSWEGVFPLFKAFPLVRGPVDGECKWGVR